MTKPADARRKSRKFAPVGVIFAVLGLLLFAYFVRKAGVSEVIGGIRRLGAGVLLIIGLSAVRQSVRSLAWTKCFEPPGQLRFGDAFIARVMGDALGNIIPLASVAVSEPSKAVFVRHKVPLLPSVAALALENIFYSLSVVIFIFSGTTALLLSFPLPKPLRYASFAVLATTALIAPCGYLLIRKQWGFLSGALSFLHVRGLGSRWTGGMIPRAQSLESRIYGFYDRNRRRLLPIFALEVCFHLTGVAEIYATLSFISEVREPTLLTAFILESVNRVINVAFKFVPLRTGVDEAGTGMLAKVLGFTTAIGVTLAIVRKSRDLFWVAVGVALMVRRGLSVRLVARETEKIAGEVASGAAETPSVSGQTT